jgi:paraquat-inducible protein B
MSQPANPKLIGAFVLGAIVLIVAGIVVLGGGRFFERTTPVVMFFQGSVSGLAVGSPVNFRGVRVGRVTNVFIRYAPDSLQPVEIPVFAEFSSENVRIVAVKDEKQEMRRATDDRLRKLVNEGLRAQLTLPSLVTGQTTISLDFFPRTAITVNDTYSDRVQIPTVPSTLQEVQTTLQQIYEKLQKLPLDELIGDARNVIKGANQLVNDPAIPQALDNASQAMADLQRTATMLDSRIGPLIASLETTSATATQTLRDAQQAFGRLDGRGEKLIAETDKTMRAAERALGQAERVLTSTNTLIAPGAPLTFELTQALREAAAAARSLRELSEQLQRNPNSLLFGRPPAAGASR